MPFERRDIASFGQADDDGFTFSLRIVFAQLVSQASGVYADDWICIRVVAIRPCINIMRDDLFLEAVTGPAKGLLDNVP
jgi:hypothetical protein